MASVKGLNKKPINSIGCEMKRPCFLKRAGAGWEMLGWNIPLGFENAMGRFFQVCEIGMARCDLAGWAVSDHNVS